MKIEWIGHSCFRLTAADGTVVITDPYDDSVGIELVPLEADLVTMSHNHHDHNFTGMLRGAPRIARGVELAHVGSVSARAVDSYHDDAEGAMRGPNAIRIFSIDGLKVVHMGDQGCMPSKDAIIAIADADVMLLPTGGFYTVDARGAKAIVEAAHPRCVIPMHFKTMHCGYPIEGVKPFLTLMGVPDAKPVAALEVEPGSVPQGVVLMQCLTDEI